MQMDGLFTLLSLSTVMAVAYETQPQIKAPSTLTTDIRSYLAGWLPLTFSLSSKHSRIVSSIGTGLLIGTCLIIIIPEGIGTLYGAQQHGDDASAPYDQTPDYDSSLRDDGGYKPLRHRRDGVEHAHDHAHDPHAWVGMALLAGFIMMYLIDQLPRHAAKLSIKPRPLHISLAELSSGLRRPEITTEEEGGQSADAEAQSKSFATTVGLVIHACADGIALAASSFIAETSVGFVVFLALMVHKAPAAFGLTSVLLKQGLTKRQARAHLIVFALAAPVGAIATWLLVNLISGGEIDGEESTRWWTGLLLIFSGGTFL